MPKVLTDEQIQEIREARRHGAPLSVLAQRYDVYRSTILRHVTDIEPEEDGRFVLLVPFSELANWRPAAPWESLLPLPIWFIRMMGLDWQAIRLQWSQARQEDGHKAATRQVVIKEIVRGIEEPPKRRGRPKKQQEVKNEDQRRDSTLSSPRGG